MPSTRANMAGIDVATGSISVLEALLLSVVTIVAAWSGYSAAKWGTESSLNLAKASATRHEGEPLVPGVADLPDG